MMPATKKTARGFTLLEAIVAIAIIGIALVPLLSFISQASLQLRTAADSNARSLAKQDIVAYFETVNPLAQENGNANIAGLNVAWRSVPIVAPNLAIRPGTGLASFSVGFFDVAVAVMAPDGSPWFDFSLRKVGYRRINDASPFGFEQ